MKYRPPMGNFRVLDWSFMDWVVLVAPCGVAGKPDDAAAMLRIGGERPPADGAGDLAASSFKRSSPDP